MDKGKLIKQLAVIFGLIAFFALFNAGIYHTLTYRYKDNSSALMREKSIDADKYLPFDENSLLVKHDSAFKLSENLPVLDGATALLPVYAAFMHAVYPENSVDFDGQDFTAASYIKKTGTGAAYKAVVDGGADIIFVAQPSAGQVEYAEQNGAELVYVPIGFEAFVFIVNANNPVDSLTAEQIKGIYAGEYKNWRDVGGENTPLIAVQRVEGSGSQTAMVSFMGDTPLMKRPASIIGRAIGYSFRFYVSDLAGKENVKILAVNGVYPSGENIRNGTYPIVDSFFAVYRADNRNENIKPFIDWILSDEGQGIISETGYVPVRS